MATMAEKMAASLEELRKLQEKDRCVVLQGTAEIGRTHLTRLLDNGCLNRGSNERRVYCGQAGNRGGYDGLVHLILVFYCEICGRPAGGTVVFDGRPVVGSVFGENDRARTGGYQIAERPE